MVTNVLGTCPKNGVTKYAIRRLLEEFDVHQWIIGIERYRSGELHYQFRFALSGNYESLKEWNNRNQFGIHFEQATAGPFDTPYERKEGRFWTSEDTTDIRKVRFGSPNSVQNRILEDLGNQSVREVDVYLDPHGNHGKTWLSVHLWETGRALVIPRASTTPDKLSAFVCSAWKGEEIIIIDIPRAQKIDPRIYETIEELKDGLVFDHRYSGRTRNIRGTKVLVFTNTPLDKSKLSHDRWRLHGITRGRAGAVLFVTLRTALTPPLGGGVREVRSKRFEKGFDRGGFHRPRTPLERI